MISDERFEWIGVGIILVAVAALVAQAVKVLRGVASRSSLFDEILQDVALTCLGASLLFKRGTTERIGLMGVFVVLFGCFVTKRIWSWRTRDNQDSDTSGRAGA